MHTHIFIINYHAKHGHTPPAARSRTAVESTTAGIGITGRSAGDIGGKRRPFNAEAVSSSVAASQAERCTCGVIFVFRGGGRYILWYAGECRLPVAYCFQYLRDMWERIWRQVSSFSWMTEPWCPDSIQPSFCYHSEVCKRLYQGVFFTAYLKDILVY